MDLSLQTQVVNLPFPFNTPSLYRGIPNQELRHFIQEVAVFAIPHVLRQRFIVQDDAIDLLRRLRTDVQTVAERVHIFTKHGVVPIIPRLNESDPVFYDPEQFLAVSAAVWEEPNRRKKPFDLSDHVAELKANIGDSFLSYNVRDPRFPPEFWERRTTLREGVFTLEQPIRREKM